MAPLKTYHLVIIAIALLIHFVIQTIPQLDTKSISDIVAQVATRLPGHQANADIDRTIHQVIESRRFFSESHYVTTQDGYVLHLHRIVNSYVKDRSKLKPVLLFHGFQCSGSLWVVASNGTLMNDGHYYEFDENNKPVNGSVIVGNTLGFVLATRGYDVWLANYRGSTYSSNHTTLSSNDPQFWSFSMDEMINIDLPAIIDYVSQQTNSTNLAYIGHSQGTFLMFSLLSSNEKYNEIVKPFIALSPIVYTKDMQTPSRHLQIFQSTLRSNPWSFFHIDRWRIAYSQLCSNKYLSGICFSVYSFFLGTNQKNIDMSRLGVYLANIPMGSSSMNAAHFFQMITKGGLPTRFDYGDSNVNMAVYGTETPPLYNISNIKSNHIALIYVKDDWFNSMTNVHQLKNELTVNLLEDYQVPESSYNHIELVWAVTVGKYVNAKVLEILSKF